MERLNNETRKALEAMERLQGEVFGATLGEGVQKENYAVLCLLARKTGEDVDGSVRHISEMVSGGSRTLQAGALADLFARDPGTYALAAAIYEYRKGWREAL